jgi:hypothetical protein
LTTRHEATVIASSPPAADGKVDDGPSLVKQRIAILKNKEKVS